MDLNQLLYRRLSQDNLLNGTLSKYADKPAIFNTEFPPDQQRDGMGKASIRGFLMSSTNRWIQRGLHLASLLSHCTTSWIRLK